jgi:hypothetical protein
MAPRKWFGVIVVPAGPTRTSEDRSSPTLAYSPSSLFVPA